MARTQACSPSPSPRLATCLLVASSQTRTIPSAAATASSRPSGLNAAPGLNGVVQTPFAGWRLPKPGSAAVRRPLLERQTLASPVSPTVTSSRPSRLKRTRSAGPSRAIRRRGFFDQSSAPPFTIVAT